ncbi:BTB/POZ domain-containing protein At5g47800 isoform X2 [Rhododendron vialii]|uniref:BTB/POZ domain-containing protein At5g47800 isoform X2 n=1 Tax=Rhododendron vialii TaxID=182163 RepID=UPI00265FB11C|nr:BTB/POZ domain-containing protein At5g47800 isoform X2 [Rhododendron vialii]
MKFMKLGTRPDTFYTEEAARTVVSDVSSDLIIKINNITYHLHKHQLLPKCGLLQRICSDSEDSNSVTLELHDIPGGEDAFELCAKFCYGITINLSAHNTVPAFCAAKFLRMTESVEKGNLVLKLEAFFNSCILEGWKDVVVALQSTGKLPEWSENLGITRRCIDSVIEKILTPPTKVTWSYTYTRPGYSRKQHQLAPKDWWTEDVSDLDIDLFRCIITAVRSANILSPQLIGEALHVYASRWLPNTSKSQPPESSASQTEDVEKKQRILETIANMIPGDRESVSVGFLLRLLSIANFLGASPVTKGELIRRSCVQLEEATMTDLLFPSHSSSGGHFYDVDLVGGVLQSFLVQQRRQHTGEEGGQSLRLIRKVGKLIDSYLQVIARDVNLPVSKVVTLAQALPEIARPDHDDLYKTINIYLKAHPDLAKPEKKQLCSILDCQKLSPEVRAHAVRNERLPLRTVVQVLFFEQERGSGSTSRKPPPVTGDQENLSKSKVSPDEKSHETQEGTTRTRMPNVTERSRSRATNSEVKLIGEPEQNLSRKELEQREKGRMTIGEEGISGSKFEFPSSSNKVMAQRRTNSKGRSSR